MPELPEVETVARQLASIIRGRSVKRLTVLDPLLGRLPATRLSGRRVEDVFRLGKQVVLALSSASDTVYMVVHLRMTGRLLWFPHARLTDKKHLRARLSLDGGSVLFHDVRRFGTIKVADSLDDVRPAGLDPVTEELTAATLGKLLANSRQELKAWLLRQDRLVGIGNIYASEVLFEAHLHPCRPAGSLSAPERRRLAGAIRCVLAKAIDCCGTTFSDFQTARGTLGSYQQYLKVFKRQGQDCGRCGASIERMVQQGRSTFYCPGCQG